MLSPFNVVRTKDDWSTPLATDLRTWHVLSRTTFGPLPADVERVKQTGIAAFLEEQLHPEKIDDSAIDKRIASLPTLSMTPAELMEEFPPLTRKPRPKRFGP